MGLGGGIWKVGMTVIQNNGPKWAFFELDLP